MSKRLFYFLSALFMCTFVSFVQPSRHLNKSEFKYRFLKAINNIRASGCYCGSHYMPPVSPLVWNDQLANAAINHSYDMASNNYFSHNSWDGSTLQDRLYRAGYNNIGYQSYTIGENIAQGQPDIDAVMHSWLTSEGHCKNLMSANFKEVGVAEYHLYWVQDFGGRISFSNRDARNDK